MATTTPAAKMGCAWTDYSMIAAAVATSTTATQATPGATTTPASAAVTASTRVSFTKLTPATARAILTTADGAFVIGTAGLVRLDKVGFPTAGPFPTGDGGSFSHAAWTCGGDFVLAGGRTGAVAIRYDSGFG